MRYYDPGIGSLISAGTLTVTPNDAVAAKAWGEHGVVANPQDWGTPLPLGKGLGVRGKDALP